LAEIDNTLAGAKKRLDEFTSYKTKHKGELLASFLALESLYNQIARRLSDAKRPEFTPSEGCSVKNLSGTLEQIEEKETKLQVQLHEEYNRQIKLANTSQRHTSKSDELRKWGSEKKMYLATKEEVKSVGSATYQLNILADFQNEFKGVEAVFSDLKKTGDYLGEEKFEDIKSVRARESELEKQHEELTSLAKAKKEILDDDLEREKFAEKTLAWNHDHQRKYEKLQAFVSEKKVFLEAKPEINSVSDAKLQIDLLEAYESEKKLIYEGNFPVLQQLGGEIRGAKYESKFSVWVLPDLVKVQKREMTIEAGFQELDSLSGTKSKILKDALSREEFREKYIRRNQEHIDKFNILDKWIKEKTAYLKVREEIKSSSDAETHLGILVAYQKERTDTHTACVPPLKALGVDIVTAEYKSSLSQYKFPTPQEVKDREDAIDKSFVELDKLHTTKHSLLVDDLKREEFREKVELWNQKHVDKNQKIQAFISQSSRYLKKKDPVNSIADANLNLARLRQYFDEQKDNNVKLAELEKLGTEIRDAKYETHLSNYVFPTPKDVTEREQSVAAAFKDLADLSAKKQAVLDDDLVREEFREKLRQWNLGHIGKHRKINEFCVQSKVYLQKKEPVSSIADAQLNLARIREYIDEKKINDVKFENLQAVGEQIKTAEHKSELSQYKFKTPEEIDAREKEIKSDFAQLDEACKKKLAILEDDLARENFKEELRQRNLKHIEKGFKLHEFIQTSKMYLLAKDEVSSIPTARLNLARFKEYGDEKKISDVKLNDLRAYGAEIKKAEYKTPLSAYKYPAPEEIDGREKDIVDAFKELETLANAKFDILNDDLEREEFKEKVRQSNQDHVDKYHTLQNFITASRKYLKTKEPVASISEAQVNLDRLRSYFGDKADHDIKLTSLKALGKQIRAAEFKKLSTWKWPNPKEIDHRENDCEVGFAELDLLSGEKDEVNNDKTEWLRKQAESLQLLLGEGSDSEPDDDDDDEEHKKESAEHKERVSRRKSVQKAVGLMSKGEYKGGGKLAVLKDDLAREQFKQKLRRWNKQHTDSFKLLTQWVSENRAYLEKKEHVDSIADAEANLARLRAYETAKQDTVNVNVSALKKLGSELLSAEYKTDWSQWKWETPDEVKTREDEINHLFQVLDKLSAKKLLVLEDDLAREQFREKLRLAGKSHEDRYTNIKAWAAAMKETLEKKESVNSIQEANNNLASLHAALADKEDATKINVSFLKTKGAEILGAEYKTELSSYVYPDPGAIKSREFQVDKEWTVLDDLAAKKKAVLDEDLKRELHKEELRLSFANSARDFARFAQDTIQESKEAHFGFTLGEVKGFKDTLDKQHADHTARSEKNKKEYEKLHHELKALNVTENVYTKHTPETLNKSYTDLHTALSEKNAAYATELKKKQENDALCQNFAHKADTLAKSIKAKKDSINTSKKDLEAQLKDAENDQEELKKSDELAKAKEAQAKIDAAGVTNNPHTVLTVPDLDVAVSQFSLFLETKREVLGKEVEHKRLRGITPQQMAEIDRQFKSFDKDGSGKLDRSEFKACLYSLGEELGKRDVQAMMDKAAAKTSTEKLTYDQFKEFMIGYFGVVDTKDNVAEAWKDIAQGDEKSVSLLNIVPRRMEVFTDADLEFFKSTTPKTDGKAESWDYIPFVAEVFSR